MFAIVFWAISTFGLMVSGIGSVYLFKGAAKDTTGYGILAGNNFSTENLKLEKRKKLSRIGFAFLIIGTVMQFVGILGQFPH